MSLRIAIVLVLLIGCGVCFAATTYEVGPGKPFLTLASLPALGPGDIVQISGGPYNEVKRWTNAGTAGNPITIRGVGAARSVIDANGKNVDGAMPNPRAVFQIEASHIVIEHLEFANARNSNNGAGVRVTGSGITGVIVRDCRMHDNDMGMMGDSFSSVLFEYCEIDNNGSTFSPGLSHNIYVGDGDSITFRGCYIHDSTVGQNVKSRAHFTALFYNYIADSKDGEVGLVDSPSTTTANSNAVMIGNIVISKDRGPLNNNTKFVEFGHDVGSAHSGTLFAYNNTFIAALPNNTFLHSTRADAAIVANNNVCVGSVKISDLSVGSITGANNWLPTGATVPAGFTGSVLGSAPGFVTPNTDLHLLVGAACRNIGVAGSTYLDGAGASQSGVPDVTYEGLSNLTARVSDGSLDAGAYEYVAPGGVPELDVTRAGAVADGGTDSVASTTAGVATNLTYTLTNSGTTTLSITGASTIAGQSNCTVSITSQPSSSVASGGTTSLVVAITPTSAGAWSFTVSTPNDDSNENPYNWTVSGSAAAVLAPELDVTRSGAIADGGIDSVTGTTAGVATNLTYTLTNSGTSSLTMTGATTFSSASNCTVSITTQPNGSVAASGTTSLVVSVTPIAAGAWSFTLSTPNNDSNENPYNWTVSGSAAATSAPELDVTRSGAVADGGTDSVTGTTAGVATNLTYTLTNSGTASLTVTGATTFASAVNCTVSITTQPSSPVVASSTTTLVVSVTPTAAGAWSFTLSTPNDDSNENPYNWTVSGSATAAPAPELDVTRASVAVADGGTDTVTSSTAGIAVNLTYVLTNSGPGTLSITASTTFASALNGTVVITTQPASSVAASGTTTLVVSVTPTVAGAWSFTMNTPNDDSNENPYNWTVTGNATVAPAPELDVTRASVAVANGGSNSVSGTTSGLPTSVTYTLSNNGTATLSVTGASSVTGQTNCTATIMTQPTAIVAAGANTSLVVSVTPTAAGGWSFVLSTPNNDSNENPYSWLVSSPGAGPVTTIDHQTNCGLGSGFSVLLGLLSLSLLGARPYRRRS